MTVLIVIPARYPSVRYPGKPLAILRGATGEAKTLIRRSWEAAQEVTGDVETIVATDDDRIAAEVESFGGRVVMTSDQCRNGTERCADALERLKIDPEAVINLQGDAPLTPPWFIDALIERIRAGASMATPVLRCSEEALAGFLEDRREGRVGGTTAVFANDNRALYFSKEVIPYTAGKLTAPVYHHVGVYAYTAEALAAYQGWEPGKLEQLEGLEQLRFLENGWPVDCVEVEARGRAFWELNNPEDVPRIEAMLAREGIA